MHSNPTFYDEKVNHTTNIGSGATGHENEVMRNYKYIAGLLL